MLCDRCGSNPIDIMDPAGVGLCLRCYTVVLDEREVAPADVEE